MKLLYGLLLISTVFADNQWATYPAVPKTASINGFADPIYDDLPTCAKSCVELSTGSTPCPYWDTGCLCVMPQWSGQVASCFAKSCEASDVASATALAYSLCTRVGANVWMMPASISTAVSEAASGIVLELSATRSALVTSSGDSSVAASTSSIAEETGSTNSTSSATGSTSKVSTSASSSQSGSSGSSGNGAEYTHKVSNALALLCVALYSIMS